MAASATVVLTEGQQEIVNRLVGSGLYHGADEVISAGLHLLDDRNREARSFIEGLEKEVLLGIESGPAAPIESAEKLVKMFRQRM